MSSSYVPDDSHIARHVPFSKLIRDEEGRVIGCLPAAFHLRPNEEYLSASWVEFFAGTRLEQLSKLVATVASSRTLGAKSAFAVGNVGRIKDACERGGSRLRVIHEPELDNEAHVAVRRWPREEEQVLLGLIAADVWNEIVLTKDHRQ